MRRLPLLILLSLFFIKGTAMAASIDGRLGLTGKVGFYVPIQDDFISSTTDSKTGLVAGGGLIYGVNDNFAAELDITHVPTIDIEISGTKVGEAALTDLSLGLQYRFTPKLRLVPYVGAGVDLITGDFKNQYDQKYDMDWTYGGHVKAGVDYFATRSIAISAEIQGIFAAKGDMEATGLEYDPTGFVGTVGIRLFLPDNLFD